MPIVRSPFLHTYNSRVDRMLESQTRLAKTQEMISTGKNFVNSGDDPVAMSKVTQLKVEQSKLEQYIKNADSLNDSLALEDTQLQSFNQVLIQIKEKTLHIANGTLSKQDRESVTVEIRQKMDDLARIANTQSSAGEYIFAGFKGGSPAYVKDASGAYQYQGDEGQRFINVSSDNSLAVNNSGKEAFESSRVVNEIFFSKADVGNTSKAILSDAVVDDQNLMDASDPQGYTLTYNDDAAGSPPQPYFTVEGNSDLSSVDITLNSSNQFSVHGLKMSVDVNPDNGDKFVVNSNPSPKKSIMSVVDKLLTGIEKLHNNETSEADFNRLASETIKNINFATEHISKINSDVGARMNALQNAKNINEEIMGVNKEVITNIEDVDYTKAISTLTQESFTLQAAQQTFSKISTLSLFDFMR